jgi:hypothetical protein
MLVTVIEPISQRSIKLDTGEYTACARELTAKQAADIAEAHRGMYSWGHRRSQNVAMAAWWQSVSDSK